MQVFTPLRKGFWNKPSFPAMDGLDAAPFVVIHVCRLRAFFWFDRGNLKTRSKTRSGLARTSRCRWPGAGRRDANRAPVVCDHRRLLLLDHSAPDRWAELEFGLDLPHAKRRERRVVACGFWRLHFKNLPKPAKSRTPWLNVGRPSGTAFPWGVLLLISVAGFAKIAERGFKNPVEGELRFGSSNSPPADFRCIPVVWMSGVKICL